MSAQATIVPAQLSYLVIYNPSLGPTDETIADQIVFYTSRSELERRQKKKGKTPIRAEDEAAIRNEQLRQVGLAQGLVNFTRDFSHGEPASSVDSEKSRLIIHELEDGWWILACVDLTQIISKPAGSKAETPATIEYSARELAPAAVLVGYLIKKYNIFLLHHGSSLAELFNALSRKEFCALLSRFWIRAAWLWDVLLRGNPAVDAYGGIRIAAGGELGVGVGEEERGSGEREVLEGLVFRTEGLIDLFVSKFSMNIDEEQEGEELTTTTVNSTGPADGMIFTGLGEVSRTSLRDIASWMEELSEYGRNAYGITERSLRRQKHKRAVSVPLAPSSGPPPGSTVKIPQPLQLPIRTADKSTERSSGETVLHYLTLGYGSSWIGKDPKSPTSELAPEVKPATGQFLVGLRGDAEDENSDDDSRDEGRISSYNLYVNLKDSNPDLNADSASRRKVNIVVYVQAPFVFLLMFEPDSDILKKPSFYRSLHHQLGPLQRPLLRSTIYAAESTLRAAFLPGVNGKLNKDRPIYTMLYDPQTMTTLSTLPNIPEPPLPGQHQRLIKSDWGRFEALQIHQLLLSTIASTRTATRDMERTTKTSRGWWVVWMRLPPSPSNRREGISSVKEAFLVRKSSGSDDGQLGPREMSAGNLGIPRWGIGNVGAGARGMVEGIGVDVKGYVEGLLKLTR